MQGCAPAGSVASGLRLRFAPWKNGLSGGCLTRRLRLGWSERLARIRVGSQLTRQPVANQRLRRWERTPSPFYSFACHGAQSRLRPDATDPPAGRSRTRHVAPAARFGQAAPSVRKLHRRRPHPSRQGFATAVRTSNEPTLILANRTANPSRGGIVRHAPEVQFSGRSPRCRRRNVPRPAAARRRARNHECGRELTRNAAP